MSSEELKAFLGLEELFFNLLSSFSTSLSAPFPRLVLLALGPGLLATFRTLYTPTLVLYLYISDSTLMDPSFSNAALVAGLRAANMPLNTVAMSGRIKFNLTSTLTGSVFFIAWLILRQ